MVAAALAVLALAAPAQWTRTDLPVPKAHPDLSVVSRGVNARGDAIYEGTYGKPGHLHQLAFLWRGGKLIPLTVPGATWIDVNALNARGDVVGDSNVHGGVATIWHNGKATLLAGAHSTALGVSADGTAVGNDDGLTVVWRNGVETTLAGPSGRMFINAVGQVAYDARGLDGLRHAFLWSNGTTTDLGSAGAANASVMALNNSGVVVGYAANSLGVPVTALEWANGQLLNLGTFGAITSSAVDVNDAGDVLVELASATGAVSTAVVVRNGAPLGIPGGSLIATSLDEDGQVLGYTQSTKQGRRSFVWRNGRVVLLPTSDGARPPWGGPNTIAGAWAIGDEYVGRTAHAVLWHRR
jgi:probable HAF family extracellular repeat protein